MREEASFDSKPQQIPKKVGTARARASGNQCTRSCRNSIIFDELDNLLCCLQAIAADPDVTIVRVNNRLSRDYDASLTASYRCQCPGSLCPPSFLQLNGMYFQS